MSNEITGNEPAYASDINYGMTLRQKALLEFMCEIMKHKDPMENHKPENCATLAEKYVTAYINQLNKEI